MCALDGDYDIVSNNIRPNTYSSRQSANTQSPDMCDKMVLLFHVNEAFKLKADFGYSFVVSSLIFIHHPKKRSVVSMILRLRKSSMRETRRWCTTRNYKFLHKTNTPRSTWRSRDVYLRMFSRKLIWLFIIIFLVNIFLHFNGRINFIHKFIKSIVTPKLNVSHYSISFGSRVRRIASTAWRLPTTKAYTLTK